MILETLEKVPESQARDGEGGKSGVVGYGRGGMRIFH